MRALWMLLAAVVLVPFVHASRAFDAAPGPAGPGWGPAAMQSSSGGATGSSEADWPMYSRDLAGTRFSPLAQITTDNVARLTQAWAYPLTTAAGGPRRAAPGPGRGG